MKGLTLAEQKEKVIAKALKSSKADSLKNAKFIITIYRGKVKNIEISGYPIRSNKNVSRNRSYTADLIVFTLKIKVTMRRSKLKGLTLQEQKEKLIAKALKLANAEGLVDLEFILSERLRKVNKITLFSYPALCKNLHKVNLEENE